MVPFPFIPKSLIHLATHTLSCYFFPYRLQPCPFSFYFPFSLVFSYTFSVWFSFLFSPKLVHFPLHGVIGKSSHRSLWSLRSSGQSHAINIHQHCTHSSPTPNPQNWLLELSRIMIIRYFKEKEFNWTLNCTYGTIYCMSVIGQRNFPLPF